MAKWDMPNNENKAESLAGAVIYICYKLLIPAIFLLDIWDIWNKQQSSLIDQKKSSDFSSHLFTLLLPLLLPLPLLCHQTTKQPN